MNFDYAFIPLKFSIESALRLKVFHLSFLYEPYIKKAGYEDYYATTCAMNSDGLFCACQEIEPYIEGPDTPGPSEMQIDDQYEGVSNFSKADELLKFVESRTAVQGPGPSLHNLFADKHGNAFVAETDNSQNLITPMDGRFIVMSNFGNYTLWGKSYREAQGVGAQRYQIAHEYLLQNMNSFDVHNGFDLLDRVRCEDKGCETLCSLVFQPAASAVYIALNLDMDRAWKVSLSAQTIETASGCSRYQKRKLDEKGIRGEALDVMGA